MTICYWFASFCNECITTALRWLFLNLSMTNLCTLSIDRCIAIVLPFKYPIFTTKTRHLFLLAAAWILPFVGPFSSFRRDVLCWDEKCSGDFLYVDTVHIQVSSVSSGAYILFEKTLYTSHKQKKLANVQLSQVIIMHFLSRTY